MKTVVHGCGVIISIALNAAKRVVKTQRLRLQVQRSAFTNLRLKSLRKEVNSLITKARTADETPVIITVGIACRKKGILKLIRGKFLPLKVSKSASAETVREEALKKRAAYDRSFRSDQTYKLCYPDGSEVVNLPGSDEPFTLEKYKDDLGKAYSRITLLLCPLQEMDIHDEQEHVNIKTRDHDEESEFMSLS